MRWVALTGLLTLSPAAHAQAPSAYTGQTGAPAAAGEPLGLSEPQASGAAKTDLRAGQLQDASGNTVIRLGNAGTHSAWYPPTGERVYGPVTSFVQDLYGFGAQAQGLSIFSGTTQQAADNGCALGGFGAHLDSRSWVFAADKVSFCNQYTMGAPLAVVSYPSAVSFSNDPANTVQQFTNTSFGGAPAYTGLTAPDTLLTFSTPLSAAVVARLHANMVIWTSTGWAAGITSWDPAGGWIKVDYWADFATGGVAKIGFDPRALQVPSNPTGAIQSSLQLIINPTTTGYGQNHIVTMASDAYCMFGNYCQIEGDELTLINDNTALGFTRNEYTPFADNPRNIGHLTGAQGPVSNSAGYAVYGGLIDKAFIAGEGTYAGFLVSPFGDNPMGDGFLSQQPSGNCFAVKNIGVQDYTFRVDCRSGATRQGGQGPKVETVRNSVSLQSASAGIVSLTSDGASPAVDGINEPVEIPANSSVSMVADLQVWNPTDSNRQLTYRMQCLYLRVGSGAPTLTGSTITPQIPATATAGYSEACGVDTATNRATITAQQTAGGVAYWQAALTATVNGH